MKHLENVDPMSFQTRYISETSWDGRDRSAGCHSLNLKCLPQAGVLKVFLPQLDDSLWGGRLVLLGDKAHLAEAGD